MKRNPHIVVQQVCPCTKTKDGKYKVLVGLVHYKGIIAQCSMSYPTKQHARWAQHFICTVKNDSRLRCFDGLRDLIDQEEGGQQ